MMTRWAHTNQIDLPIIELAATADPQLRAFWDETLRPGSVAVAYASAQQIVVYYEGGLYTRDERPPTTAERELYAKLAAGRLREHYPTIARLVLPLDTPLVILGYVDPHYQITWLATAEPWQCQERAPGQS